MLHPAKKRTAVDNEDRSERATSRREPVTPTSMQPRKKKRVQDIDITEEEDETYRGLDSRRWKNYTKLKKS